MLKGYLAEKGVQYTEKVIDQDVASQEEMMKLSDGFMGVPFTVIKKDDGTVLKIRGFDKEKVDEVLAL
jgi:glutaredoxin